LNFSDHPSQSEVFPLNSNTQMLLISDFVMMFNSTTCKLLHFHFSDVPSLSKPYSVMYTSLSKSTCLLYTSVMYTHY
jgi:hypothetical protein